MQEQFINEGQKRLHEWMSANNFTITRTAKLADLSYSTLWHISAGAIPNLITAEKLFRLSKGYIPYASWLQAPSKKRADNSERNKTNEPNKKQRK